MSKGHFQTGSQSGRRTLERCKFKGKAKNVVYVDVEDGKTHDVIFIDTPESSKKSLLGSSTSPKKLPSENFISIDDDEINVDEAENCDKGGGDQDIGGTPSKAPCPAFSQSRRSKESKHDEFQFTRGKNSPVTFSKSRRTYSGKTFSRNRFGLSPLYDSSSSDSDSSDCELMEGSSGKIREQWEQAASKKRKFDGVPHGDPGLNDEASGSGSLGDIPSDAGVENTNKQHEGAPFCSTSNDANNFIRNPSTSTASGNGTTEDPFLTPEEDLVADLGKAVDQDSPSWCRTPLREEAHILHKKIDTRDAEKTFQGGDSFSDAKVESDRDDNTDEPYNLMKEGEIPVDPQFGCENVCFQEEGENVTAESFWFNYEATVEPHFNHEKTILQDEEVSFHSTEKTDETHVRYQKIISPGVEEMIHRESSFSNIQAPNSINYEGSKWNYKEKPFSGEPSLWSNEQCGKVHVNSDLTFSPEKDESVSGEDLYQNGHVQRESEVFHESINHQDNERPGSNNHSANLRKNETQVNLQTACSMDENEPALESNSDTRQNVERSTLHAQDGTSAHDVENNIICEREKLKETDEYKRATEEEWASRQRELQLQAEEAQRLRKRKRAEAQRTLDVERRQKERLEEMRERQKKNVDTINLKEQLRAEVRKELGRLEVIHTDMVSLLRALGISVGSGFYPTSSEVNAAYKQALLRFHPDRASRTDIRQQVEAEEKFKLVSRLKEKITTFTTSTTKF